MKNTSKRIAIDRTKLLGFRKVKSGGKDSTKPLTVAMVGGAKPGLTKVE